MKVVISIKINKPSLQILRKNFCILSKQTFLENKQNNIEIFISYCDLDIELSDMKSFFNKFFNNLKINFIRRESELKNLHNQTFKDCIQNLVFDYFLVADQDTIFHPRAIENLVIFSKSKKDFGIFEALQFPAENPKFFCKDSAETSWCSARCCLYPVGIFDNLDGFDDGLIKLWDVDISWRARFSKIKCYTVSNSIFHYPSKKIYSESDDDDIKDFKSAYYLAMKYDNYTFKEKALQKLKSIMDSKTFDNFIKTPINNKNYDFIKFKSIANFKNDLFFSEVRW